MSRDYDRQRWGRRYAEEDDRSERTYDRGYYARERPYGGSRYSQDYDDQDRGTDYGRDFGARDYRSAGGGGGYDRDLGSGGPGNYGGQPGRRYGRRDDTDLDYDRGRYSAGGGQRSYGRDYDIDYDRNRSGYGYTRYGATGGRHDRRDERDYDPRSEGPDWVEQVPEHHRRRGPYEDYGWEAGESVLPQFRDPSVRQTSYERGYGRQDRGERSFWDRARDQVASWFGADEGNEAREGGYRGRGPRGYRRSDDRIREDINDRLTDNDFLDASDINVTVENGEVVLLGIVYNRTAKRLAENIAESVSGVTNVENRLRVIEQGTTARGAWDTRENAGRINETGAEAATGTTDKASTTTAGATGSATGKDRTGNA